MNYLNTSTLNAAIKDGGVQLKHLVTDDFIKTLKLIKKISAYLDGSDNDVNALITEYNKDFVKRKQELLELAVRTEEEEAELKRQPPVRVLQGGFLAGPTDFVEKVEKLREPKLEFADKELHFITDKEVFKKVVENASSANQVILYEHLFKE